MHIYMSWCALCVRVCVCACVCACVCVCVCVCVELNTRVHAWPWVPPHHAHECICNALQHTATHTATQGYRRLSECPCIIRTRVSTTHCNTLQHTATHCNTHCNTGVQAFAWDLPHHAHTGVCNTLQHTATNCNTLQHAATHTATQGFRRLPGFCHIMREGCL